MMANPELVLVLQGVGFVLSELMTAIAEARKNKPSLFKKALDLDTLQETLTSIKPVIGDMERLNHQMGRSGEELESLKRKMEEGTKLLKECSKVGWGSKSSYMAKLEAFDVSFSKLLNTILAAQTARDQKEILLLQKSKGFRRWLRCLGCK